LKTYGGISRTWVERDLLAYLVSRIKDPDMQIQEQREYRGLNSKLKTEVHELQVEQKEYRHEIRRLEWLLDENNIMSLSKA
jgi:hypothetical protein